jgi:hypothetical protein
VEGDLKQRESCSGERVEAAGELQRRERLTFFNLRESGNPLQQITEHVLVQ